MTDLITKASSLNCTCTKPVPARSVSLSEESCKCVTSFNPTSKANYLECMCKNAPICSDPLSLTPVAPAPPKVPCINAYPCECLQDSFNTTQCNCLNPSSGIRASNTLASSQCSCQLRISNSSFINDCRCCLPEEFVRSRLIAPVICASIAVKQDCVCSNSSVTVGKATSFRQTCNCTHPQSKVVAPNLVIDANSACDCTNISLGNKACKCCIGE